MKRISWEAKLSAGRLKLVMKAPWIAVAAYGLIVKESTSTKTMGVTWDWILMVNPKMIHEWTVDEIAAVLFHEIMHVLRNHAARFARIGKGNSKYRKNQLHDTWNIACDAAINDDLEDWPLPGDFVHPEKYGMETGKIEEYYFHKLIEKEDEDNQDGGGSEAGDEEQDSDDGGQGQSPSQPNEDSKEEEQDSSGSGSDDNGDQDSDQGGGDGAGSQEPQDGSQDAPGSSDGTGPEQDGAGDGSGSGQDGAGDGSGSGQDDGPHAGHCRCGSGAGAPLPNEPQDEGRGPIEQKDLRERAAKQIQKAANNQGNVPAGLARWADEELGTPQIAWEDKLDRICHMAVDLKAGDMTSDYSRPHRWQSALGDDDVLLAHPFSHVPDVELAMDASGSMGKDELRKGMTEGKGVFDALEVPVNFLVFDAKVQKAESVASIDQACKALIGGGGTSFLAVFDYLKKRGKRPDILVIFTDGIAPAPDENPFPEMHTIWVLVGPHQRKPWKASDRSSEITWGEFCEIPVEEKKEAA
jgi:predicted metal-dependent peptidase